MSRMPEVGEIVDDVFQVESEIDSGNFGSIFKVHDQLENRTLALKVLRPGPHDEEELRRRFEREARLVYSLNHKHIVRVHYYGQTNSGLPYMAMEFLKGTDLRTLLHHHGSLGDKLIKRITTETLSALSAAHDLGIVHRDLKPANIFLVNDDDKGHVKVLDFGFAKALDDDSKSGDITNAGTLVGTPAYMSPELVHKKHVGPAADLYAMGLIMAEMLTGEKVIKIESVYDTILFQASGKPIKLPSSIRDSAFGEVIECAVSKSLGDRYPDAESMARAVYAALGEPFQPLIPAREHVHVSEASRTNEVFIANDGAHEDDRTRPRSLGPDIDDLDDIETSVRESYDLDGIDLTDVDVQDSAMLTPNTQANARKMHTPHTPMPMLNSVETPRRYNETLDIFVDEEMRPPERSSSRSGALEVILGIVLGLVVLAVLFFFLYT